MNIITVINQKGGVAKTTTAQNLGVGLLKRGYKVLLIDLDQQCNLTYTMNLTNKDRNIYDLLIKQDNIKNYIVKTDQGDGIPGSENIKALETMDASIDNFYLLYNVLEPVFKEYDYIIIDTPPRVGLITNNALMTSDKIIIPCQADIFSIQGLSGLYKTFKAVKRVNRDLKIEGILLTRYNARTNITKEFTNILEETSKKLDTKVFKTRIRENAAIKEAQAIRSNIFDYNPRSNGAQDYNAFINEMLEGDQ